MTWEELIVPLPPLPRDVDAERRVLFRGAVKVIVSPFPGGFLYQVMKPGGRMVEGIDVLNPRDCHPYITTRAPVIWRNFGGGE